MKAIKKRLTGLLIEGPLEPGNALLDTTASMMQLNEIKYIPPEKCISRTHEVLNQKSPTKQLDISAENLVVKEKQDTPDMTVTSALQVQEAFQRRGIALVFADLITHENYTRYLTTLFGHLHRDPPAGYARTNVSQPCCRRPDCVADAPGGRAFNLKGMKWEPLHWIRSLWRVSKVTGCPLRYCH